ncbi:MAG: PHP domain-containing protein, partial [Chloroflexi bacterium]|nr:PHP domain-containing protein [Chloroflexota bacterium]
MHELTINLHIHTTYSDGTGSHADVVAAALQAGLDAVIVTDHNVLVQGMEGYHRRGRKRMLLLVGEEVHDQARQPQKSHLLVVGAGRELAASAGQPQGLVDAVRTAGGLSFIAHPVDPALPVFNEDDISWEDWDVHGFTGIELWNGFSEIKTVVRSRLGALPYAYFPELVGHGPLPQTLEIWDRLLSRGAKVVAVGGSDAHALKMSMGPLRRTIFPYRFHFSAVNTHLLVEKPLCGEIETDRRMVYAALAAGHAFIGYDLPGATHGFRFSASSRERTALMG